MHDEMIRNISNWTIDENEPTKDLREFNDVKAQLIELVYTRSLDYNKDNDTNEY